MVTRNPSTPGPLTREERDAWLRAYLAATRLLKHDGLSTEGPVHFCTEFAWASLAAYREAAKGVRP